MNYVLIFYAWIDYNEGIVQRYACKRIHADNQNVIARNFRLWLVRGENRNCREKRGEP